MTVKEIADSHLAMLRTEGFFDRDNAESRGEGAVLFLTDGGCDAFLTGMETGLATPVEDMMHLRAITKYLMKSGTVVPVFPAALVARANSVAAANKNEGDDQHDDASTSVSPPPDVEPNIVALENIYDPKSSFLCAIGANVDVEHGVVERELVERLLHLHQNGILLVGKTMSAPVRNDDDDDADVVSADPEAQFFCKIVKQCRPIQTIVQSLAVAAIEGHRGFYTPEHLVPRIGRNKIPLSALTSTFFILDLVRVAGEVIYLNQIQGASNGNAFVTTLHRVLKMYKSK